MKVRRGLLRRRVNDWCQDEDRHCDPPLEHNVFARPSHSPSPALVTGPSTAPLMRQKPSSAPLMRQGPSPAPSPFLRMSNLPPCTSDDSGSFYMNGVSPATNMTSLVVNFNYQVQTTLNETATTLNNHALAVIEKGLADILVQALFQGYGCYGAISQSNSRLLLTARSELNGLSALPADQVLKGRDGVACQTQLVRNADRCYIVGGVFTLQGQGNMSSWLPTVLQITKTSMDSGLLNNLLPDVIDVHYLKFIPQNANNTSQYQPPPFELPGSGSPKDVDSSDNRSSPRFAPIIAASLALLLVFVTFVVARLARRRLKEEGSNYGDHKEVKFRELVDTGPQPTFPPSASTSTITSMTNGTHSETGLHPYLESLPSDQEMEDLLSSADRSNSLTSSTPNSSRVNKAGHLLFLNSDDSEEHGPLDWESDSVSEEHESGSFPSVPKIIH